MALVVERVRTLCFRAPVDPELVMGALPPGATSSDQRRVLDAIRSTLVGQVLAPLESPDVAAVDVALEEALLDVRAVIERGMGALRIGASLSTFLGFAGAAIEMSWIYTGDHGLLGLDPRRVAALGMNGAALSIALGIGGSSFALGSWMALRAQATRLVRECERVVDRARGRLERE